jgi:hypothetical protein
MTTPYALSLRKTSKYVDSYRHLDREEFVCSVKLTTPTMLRAPEDFDDGGQYVRFGRIPAGASRKDRRDIVQAARDTFSHWGCSHQHDCCGCQLVRADATLRGRTLRITTSVSFNY